ncbi:hypothetical protein [Agaribacter marinus]|uniref:DNA repair ATPase n=1 Tax=Agaribacter marinus TaxID=1431249 RepID=A0AA37T111_9ALTE|nr:hypothetical protein [Agaribacter marinus]GLR70298.1 DNA repair ATPase [Agaribacter marinus]
MSYTIIIILITAIIVGGIAASAVQQHNERKEAQKRDEISKHKAILDETEVAVSAASQMPVSKKLIAILRKRSLMALKGINAQSPSADIKNKIKETTRLIEELNVEEPAPDLSTFNLPSSDKMIIKYIQAVKKLRNILRVENAKGNISVNDYKAEDKTLECLQLRVNVETLNKRGNDSVTAGLQGSARQYFEKGIAALKNHKPQDEYTQARASELTKQINQLESTVKDNNMQEVLAQKKKESEDIDNLFAPKKKW